MRDDCDVITASPYHPRGSVEGVDIIRYSLSVFVSRLYRILTRTEISTFSSFFRVYRRHVIKTLKPKSNDYLIATELLVESLNKGFRIEEFPTTLKLRTTGKSSMKLVNETINNIYYLSKILFGRIGHG